MGKKIISDSKRRKRESRGDAVDVQEGSTSLLKIFALLGKAKALIEAAKKNDGRIDTSEAADIFNKLIPSLEKIGGQKIQGNIVRIRARYQTLVQAIESVPLVAHVLKDAYPAFFVLFQEDKVADTAVNPDVLDTSVSEDDKLSEDDVDTDPDVPFRDCVYEPPEDNDFDGEAMDADLGEEEPEAGEKPETGPEEQRERRKRVDALLASISAQDFWRDGILDFTEDEKSLFEFSRDELRRNYIRFKLFLDAETEGIFFDRLVVQSRNPNEARRILREILAEIKGLTVDQRREIFAEEKVMVEVGWEEDEDPEAPGPDKKGASGSGALPPPPPESPKGSLLPDPEPGPSPEPGPIPPPDAEASKGKKGSFESEKETVWARMRNWARPITDSDMYRVHMKGEKTRAEMYGYAPTLSRPAMVTGAVLSGALSYFGAAFPVDALRYLGQRFYVGNERDEISRAFHAALEERRKRELSASESADVQERSDALKERVFVSRYLTDPQKKELLDKLNDQKKQFDASTSPNKEHLTREVGRILEHTIRTRITGEKVAKEFVNSSLVATNLLFPVSGANFLRAPAYGVISLFERWRRLTREMPESKAGDRLRAMVSGGFNEYFDQLKGNKGSLAQAAAFGTIARFVGMNVTLVESVAASGFVGDLLQAWEGREAAYPSYAPDVRDGTLDIDFDDEPVSDDDSEGDSVPDEKIPVPDVSPEPDVIMSPDRIPEEALVTKGDGITQALLSAVEARPELLDVAERGALNDDYTAALLMRRMAAKDGLLDYWISEKAIGELAIVPVYDTEGVPHITFLNPETGTAYSVAELKDLGWLVKAPK